MPEGLSYRDAGVDIDNGNALIERIKPIAKRTQRPEVMAGLGGFGALFELPWQKYQQPVLVSSTDGVGTKLKLAMQLNQHDSIGIDLVAMCANDLIVQGAEPLFFLDYYATSSLELDTAEAVIQGIGQGCEQSGMALVGGETAEMPGMYQAGDYDLAGFCVGIVEKNNIIDGSQVKAGDILIGLASSGPHSNGYSLIRKIIEHQQVDINQAWGDQGQTLGSVLLSPTRIYVKSILSVLEQTPLHALAHITGGGLLENIPRVLADGLEAHINTDSWQRPAIFDWLQQQGQVADTEMWRTFNCGVGMVLCVGAEHADKVIQQLQQQGETAWRLGDVRVADSAQSPARVIGL